MTASIQSSDGGAGQASGMADPKTAVAPASPSDATPARPEAGETAHMPSYGSLPWDQLGRDVMEAICGSRAEYEFGPTYPGHVITGINFNSLSRIVDKYRLATPQVTNSAEVVKSVPLTELQRDLALLITYGKWQIAEGPGYHPTFPSALSQANATLERSTAHPRKPLDREKVARIIAGPLCDATKAEHSIMKDGRYAFCTQCGETITKPQIGIIEARNKADAILALYEKEA